MISGEQLRAARAMLRIEQTELAQRAGISVETLKRFEGTEGPLRGRTENVDSVAATLERAGIVFISENEGSARGGEGVRFAEARPSLLDVPADKLSNEELERHLREVEDEMRKRGLTVEVEAIYSADQGGNVSVTEPTRAKSKDGGR